MRRFSAAFFPIMFSPTSKIFRIRPRSCIKTPSDLSFPRTSCADVASGNLPQVSWLVGSVVTSDHPPSPSIFGENTLSLVISALTANPALWAKTLLLVTYDENGGFFDHVPPVTAPPGSPGEYVTRPRCRTPP